MKNFKREKSLFKPLDIRGIRVPNRVVLSPMQMYMAKDDGCATDGHLVHLGKYATAKFGVVFTEVLCVEKRGRSTYSDCGIWSDKHIPKLKKISDFIRSEGAIPAAQIGHSGPKSSRQRPHEGLQPLSQLNGLAGEKPWTIVSCSNVPAAPGYDKPKSLSLPQVRSVIKKFGQAADRCNQAGFDILDVHAAHGYLIHSFLSPISNFRNDEYGGCKENRFKIAIDIATEIRKFWPIKKPLFFRLSCIDRVEGGIEIDDTLELSSLLKAAGVDLIDCSSGGIKGPNSLFSLASQEPPKPGFQVPFSEKIKKECDLLTMAVGLILKPEQADQIIADDKADLVALGREALFNPNWVLHALRELSGNNNFEGWPSNIGWWLEVRERMSISSNPNNWRVGSAAHNSPKLK